jgi:PQQ-like domain
MIVSRRPFPLMTLALLGTVLVPIAGATDWPQFNFDAQHGGNNTQEATIGSANVSTLHARYNVSLPNTVDGAPAFLQSVVTPSGTKDLLFLTTKNGQILARDAATGASVWSHTTSGPNSTTSSPAIDPGRLFVYSYGLDGKVHKYKVGDGTETTTGGWPQLTTLKPSVEKGASALSIATTVGGTTYLYAANGGYPGDAGDYQGHVTAINLSTAAQNVFNTDCSTLTCHLALSGSGTTCGQASPDCSHVRSAVWARAGVVYSPALDRIFFSTGNGDYDGNAGGHDWGDTTLSIHPDGTGVNGGPVDAYTPTEFQVMEDTDADLGSTSPAILPPVTGSNVAHLGVQSQKVPGTANFPTSMIRLLNLANLSGAGGPGHVGGEIQKIVVPQGGGVLTAPAVWTDPKDSSVWIFYANGNGITALTIAVGTNGSPSLHVQWTNGTGGSSPVLANGILYYVGNSGVFALDPRSGNTLWSDSAPGGIHWESPIVVNGRLYLTDESSQLWAYEIPPPNTYTVTNTSNSTATSGSLPWAVQQANNRPGLDYIVFNIAGSGVHVITLGTTLVLSDQVVVDGTSQPGYAGAPLVYLKGGASVASLLTLQGSSSGSSVQGLGLYDYTSDAIAMPNDAGGHWIQNNYIGFYNDGVSLVMNSSLHALTRGVALQSSFNTIRGNTISGVDTGITIGEDPAGTWSGTAYKTNSIQGNRIGTNPAGTSAAGYGNTSNGLFLGAGAQQNFIGPSNVLSSNGSSGVELFHSSAVGNVVFANLIGVDIAGTAAIPNGQVGVLLSNGANGNAIGGAFGGNVIASNPNSGVSIGTTPCCGFSGPANGNWIQNNVIGLDSNQSVALGGQQVGVTINNGSTRNDVDHNVLAGHSQDGASVSDSVTNSVSNNWIGLNSSGVAKPNAVWGIYLHNASHNYAQGNAFGPNGAGSIGQDGTSCCNVIN